MKILYISDDFPPQSFGGAGIIAFRDAVALQREGHEVYVLTCVQDMTKVGILNFENIIIHRIYSGGGERWRQWRCIYNREVVMKAKEIMKEINPDIIHIHNVHNCFSYSIINHCLSITKKVFHTVHDLYSVYPGKLFPRNDGQMTFGFYEIIKLSRFRLNPLRNILIRHYLSKVAKIFVVSNAVNRVLVDHKIKNTQVLHNGIEIEDKIFDHDHDQAFRVKYSLLNKRIILFGGRISNAKGICSAIETLNKLKDEYNDLVLLVVGKADSLHSSVYELINRYNLNNRIVFTGWIDFDDMKTAIRISEFVLVLSIYLDPFPTINLESFVQKRPVIGTRFGGSPEIIIDSHNGFVVNPNDYEEVANKCRLLLNDKTMADNMGQNGYRDVVNNFSESKHIKYLESCYNRAYVFTR